MELDTNFGLAVVMGIGGLITGLLGTGIILTNLRGQLFGTKG